MRTDLLQMSGNYSETYFDHLKVFSMNHEWYFSHKKIRENVFTVAAHRETTRRKITLIVAELQWGLYLWSLLGKINGNRKNGVFYR